MPKNDHDDMPELVVLAETENFAVLAGSDADDEVIYNIELGSVSIHLFREEWEEFASLIQTALASDN